MHVKQYETINKLVSKGLLGDLSTSLFDKVNRKPCNKVFCSLSKFYAHLRVHSNEKPFVCPFDGCSLTFN